MPGRGERGVGEVAGSQVGKRLGIVTGALVENGAPLSHLGFSVRADIINADRHFRF